jgi:hypothetical protein
MHLPSQKRSDCTFIPHTRISSIRVATVMCSLPPPPFPAEDSLQLLMCVAGSVGDTYPGVRLVPFLYHHLPVLVVDYTGDCFKEFLSLGEFVGHFSPR